MEPKSVKNRDEIGPEFYGILGSNLGGPMGDINLGTPARYQSAEVSGSPGGTRVGNLPTEGNTPTAL